MSKKILEVLCSPNPFPLDLITDGGRNTEAEGWIPVLGWTPWHDFTYDVLTKLFGAYLNKPAGSLSQHDPILADDRIINDEKTCEVFLGRYIMPVVNIALSKMLPGTKTASSPYVGSGSTVESTADWAARIRHDDGEFEPLLPGDTKLALKWRPDMDDQDQWSLPVSQVLTYAHLLGSRYGFIITQSHLVVLRFCREPIGTGTAFSRPRRSGTGQVFL
ncbi:uncharacterized protein B0I36DRAFT_337359 [Microdochium trichocladiopsis]|uniref:Uncharacterized protein n=1 Tax=Microdochium trichocladiopsis TaxID=1682393 RepID=A0A9P8XVC6_9PEZI|nr:uncharacterized protein B0I36DRAFT_337359 [Microdochium trichocladiopsis]KAH7016332.1 hypothetical protein B0I36DRAFT_337359 [Microdochium trichocladiopsis]